LAPAGPAYNGTIVNGSLANPDSARRRVEVQNAIGAFIARGDALMSRVMIAEDELVETDSSVWSGEVVKYISESLGPAYNARLNSGAGISGFLKHAPSELRQKILSSLYVRVTRLNEFLKEMS
jgi:hypothetical protein